MQKLKLDDKLFSSLKTGRKRVTVLKGQNKIDLGKLTFENSDGQETEDVDVKRIYFCKLKDMDQKDVVNEGFYGKHQLMNALRGFYRNVNMNSVITVLRHDPL